VVGRFYMDDQEVDGKVYFPDDHKAKPSDIMLVHIIEINIKLHY